MSPAVTLGEQGRGQIILFGGLYNPELWRAW